MEKRMANGHLRGKEGGDPSCDCEVCCNIRRESSVAREREHRQEKRWEIIDKASRSHYLK